MYLLLYAREITEHIILCTGDIKEIGNTRADPPADIPLSGPGFYQKHARAKFVDGKMSVAPVQGKVWINGREISEKKSLHHNDR